MHGSCGKGKQIRSPEKIGWRGGTRVKGEGEGREEANMRERGCSKRGKDKEAKKGKRYLD